MGQGAIFSRLAVYLYPPVSGVRGVTILRILDPQYGPATPEVAVGVLDSLLSGGVPGAIGSIVTSGINAWSQNQTNQMSIDLANTAVQRRAKDMEAAGINPILAAGQPAAVPGMQAPRVENVVNAAQEGALKSQALQQSSAQTELTLANARAADADARVKEALIPWQVEQGMAQSKFTVQSLHDRLAQEANKADVGKWDVAIKDAEAKILYGMNNMSLLDKDTGQWTDPSEFMKFLARNRLRLSEAGASLEEARVGALAEAVAASKMNADMLKAVGVPPKAIEFIMGLAKTLIGGFAGGLGSTAGKSLGATIPW